MQTTWAARLVTDSPMVLGAIRLREGVEVGEDDDALWLRGASLDGTLEEQLRCLPGLERFRVDERGRLFATGRRAPTGSLPSLSWMPLRKWLSFEPGRPTHRQPVVARLALRLVRDEGPPREANLLLTSGTTWLAYAIGAPQSRLEPLRFAVNGEGMVMIAGTPLPPIQGQRFVVTGGIAAPCGEHWDPPVEPSILGAMIRLEPGDVAVLTPDGSHERIEAAHFVQATRSAVRLSLGSVAG